MLELGNVFNTDYSEKITGAIHNSNMNSKAASGSKKFVDDNAAVAEIHSPVGGLSTDIQDSQKNINNQISLGQSLRSSIVGFRERLSKLKQQTEEMANSRYNAGNLIKNLYIETKDSLEANDNPRYSVHSDASKQLIKLRNEIKAIASFDGFLLGVHNKIEDFGQKTEFSLEQIIEVVNNITHQNEALEVDRFSLTRIRNEALKAIRCQANVSGCRAFQLFKN